MVSPHNYIIIWLSDYKGMWCRFAIREPSGYQFIYEFITGLSNTLRKKANMQDGMWRKASYCVPSSFRFILFPTLPNERNFFYNPEGHKTCKRNFFVCF